LAGFGPFSFLGLALLCRIWAGLSNLFAHPFSGNTGLLAATINSTGSLLLSNRLSSKFGLIALTDISAQDVEVTVAGDGGSLILGQCANPPQLEIRHRFVSPLTRRTRAKS
jgi:hypothetical protein